MKKLTTKQFIEKAKKIHGDKYDYSKVEYINTMTKVCIICPKHGEFWVIPNNHLRGDICHKCSSENVSNKNRHNKEIFVKKAKQIHGDKYDYSKVEYVNNKTKVCIICPKHGEFWQTPDNHTHGKGCPKCANKNMTTEDFILKAKQIHGDKYDYSKVEYAKSNKKVCIICPKHGEFWQTPNRHLNGNGCWLCYKQGKVYNSEQFILKAKQIHGDKYDYSKIKYKNNHTKVCIICPKHGEFWQTPNDHLNNKGCPSCNESKLENEISTKLSEVKIDYEIKKHFDWLGLQHLDFYLPKYNIAIECQGLQHFKEVAHFGGSKQMKNQIELDKKKYEKAKNHGIKIIYYTNRNLLKYINSVYIYENNLFSDFDVLSKIIRG